MIRSGRSGWYYRVLQPGAIKAGDPMTLVSRPNPDFRFERLVGIVYHRKASAEDLARLADIPEVASPIRRMAQQSLGTAD